jgi:hypothetical protein
MTPPDLPDDQTPTDDALCRAQRLVNRLFAAIVAVLVVVAALTLSLRYVDAVGEGRREAGNLADLLSEYLVIRLRGIDGALSRIAADNRLIGGPEGSEREWAAAMRSAIAGVPGLSSLVVLDKDGVVRQTTVQQIRGLSWADRRIFREPAKGVPNIVVVDLPITMVAGSQVLVPFARALTDPRGDFMGAIVALLLPHQLRDFLGTFDLGQSGLAWVLLPSGDVLFRDGAVDALGPATDGEAPSFAAEASLKGDGVVGGPLVPGGADYITAYRKSAIADLVVAVSITDTRFLSRWKYEAVFASIFVAVAAVLLFFAARRIKAAAFDVAAAGHLDAQLDKPV